MKLPKFSLREKIKELESQVVVPNMREVYTVNVDGRSTTYLSRADADAEAHQAALYAARKAEKEFYEHQIVNAPKIEIPIKMAESGYRTEPVNRKLILCFVKHKAEAKAFELSQKPTGRRYSRRKCNIIPQNALKNRVMMYYVDEDGKYWRAHTSGPYRLCEPTVRGVERAINMLVYSIEGNRTTMHAEGKEFPKEFPVGDFAKSALFNPTELMIRGVPDTSSAYLPFRLAPSARTLLAAWFKTHVPDYKDPFLEITPPAGATTPSGSSASGA